MDFFNQLGTLVHDRWRSKNFDETAFAEVATGALGDLPPVGAVDVADIVRWAVLSDSIAPQQHDTDFGQHEPEPLCVYKNDLFHIEVLFWLDGTTAIHQHGFSGAFHVLAGSRVHSCYAFDVHERVNSRLLLGRLRLSDVEYLAAGETRPIWAGSRFIHAVFHLDRPSVSVVVRTPPDKEALPQYSYLKPTVAYASFEKREQTTRQLKLLDVLRQIGHADYLPCLGELIGRSDFETAFLALQRNHPHLEAGEFAALLEQARRRHGRLVDYLPPAFDEEQRLAALNGKRRLVHDANHRFLLALLLNLPDRASIFDFVRRRYDGDPANRIVAWLDELRRLPGRGDEERNCLGMNLNEVTLHVVRCLLEGDSFHRLKERLKEQYEAAEVDGQEQELRQLCGELRRSVLLRPLFVESIPRNESAAIVRKLENGELGNEDTLGTNGHSANNHQALLMESATRATSMHPVAMTARGAAAQRARESERPDRLICDPWARALAGEEGFAMLELFERRHPRIWDDAAQACVAIHTRFFDEIARRISGEGVRQVVLVGAGMDTRAFRLVWPVGTSLYELDRSELLDLKEEVLRRAGAQAGCRRVPLAVD
jgi:hypothetical protein